MAKLPSISDIIKAKDVCDRIEGNLYAKFEREVLAEFKEERGRLDGEIIRRYRAAGIDSGNCNHPLVKESAGLNHCLCCGANWDSYCPD